SRFSLALSDDRGRRGHGSGHDVPAISPGRPKCRTSRYLTAVLADARRGPCRAPDARFPTRHVRSRAASAAGRGSAPTSGSSGVAWLTVFEIEDEFCTHALIDQAE